MSMTNATFFSTEVRERPATIYRQAASVATAAFVFAHWLALASIFGILLVRAFLQFRIAHDVLTYHLPASLRWAGMTTYTPQPLFNEVIAGFPPLCHIIAGFLAWASGRISMAGAQNALVFVGASFCLPGLLQRGFSLRWYLTAALAVPLVVLHFCSGLVDLGNGAFLMLAFAGLQSLAESQRFRLWPVTALVVGAGGAALSKFQAWPTVCVVHLCAVYLFLALYRRSGASAKQAALAVGALTLAVSFWPLRNLLEFGNPVYPFEPPVLKGLFTNFIPWPFDLEKTSLPTYLWERSRPYNFVFSVFELSRSDERFPLVWTLDGGHPLGVDYPHNRLGGWYYVTVLVLLVSAACAVVKRRVAAAPAAAFCVSVLLVSCLPQSQELRYWLFVPLSLAAVFGATVPQLHSVVSVPIKASILACAVFVVWKNGLWVPSTIDLRPPEVFAPEEAKAFWKENEVREKNQPPIRVCGKNPFTLYWSGPTLNEIPVEGCF
jgi:hypothetical protein